MTARAQGVEETRRRILESTIDLASRLRMSNVTLEAIADKADVSVQTVLRQFGSRADLFAATIEVASAEVAAERVVPVGDQAAAVAVVVDHYEHRGATDLLLLSQEDEDPQVAAITRHAKAFHRRWVEQAFAPFLTGDDAVVDLLVVATDVYTWKLLRLDRGLSRDLTEQRMAHLVDAVLTSGRDTP